MRAESLAVAGAMLFLGFIDPAASAPSGSLAPESEERITPLITTAELAVGPNRFAFGLLKGQALLDGANVVVRVYDIGAAQARLAGEAEAPYYSLHAIKRGQTVHRHADGKRHVHGADTDARGLYVTSLAFARPGPWGVELLVREEARAPEAVRFTVAVLDAPQTPAVGSPAPHRGRGDGRPQLIVFATPQFCATRMCGPVLDVVQTLRPAYGKRMVFTHQEIWEDFASQRAHPAVEEWGLRTEPWIFVLDRDGIVRGRFEGLVTVRELEAAVQQVLKAGAVRKR